MATYTITIDERTLDGKNILALLKKSKDCIKFEKKEIEKKEKLKDPKEIAKKYYGERLAESIAQAERGEVTRVNPEDIDKFLGLI